ncbi:hypothetical protein QR685DRAFT_575433 [Neurospora intermedia]|uniref:Uncharacterized protein n=1 Tax=Neurospora intermedia TaxID=5142 RepID=A0ABR3D0Q8_NEUIN
MPLLAFPANLIAVVRVKSTAAGRRIEFIKPFRNGNCWIVCSSRTADVDTGYQAQGISRKHPGVDMGQNSFATSISEPSLCSLYSQGRNGRGSGK